MNTIVKIVEQELNRVKGDIVAISIAGMMNADDNKKTMECYDDAMKQIEYLEGLDVRFDAFIRECEMSDEDSTHAIYLSMEMKSFIKDIRKEMGGIKDIVAMEEFEKELTSLCNRADALESNIKKVNRDSFASCVAVQRKLCEDISDYQSRVEKVDNQYAPMYAEEAEKLFFRVSSFC